MRYNTKMKGDQREVLQDDLGQIQTTAITNNYNVRRYKKQQMAKPIRNVTHSQLSKSISRIVTEPDPHHHPTRHPSNHSHTIPEGLNNNFKFHNTFIHPHRKKQEASHPETTNHFFSKSCDHSGEGGRKERGEVKKKGLKKEGSQLQTHEKAWRGGKVEQQCFESWLNAICIQFFPNQYFDRNTPNSSLKKLGIDENSLIAKGLLPGNVFRLYRGLFVFGMGFNSLVKELTNNDGELRKTVWKIYSTILEYCSSGSLETVVGDIERENSLKLVELTTELERKQFIIEKNQELNEQKNSEIFKEIKQLRQENFSLSNEKTVLVDEYNATEQAFSEEVTLRLKFETKINEIYGLHRELGNKHQKIYHELVEKAEQLRTESEKYFQVVDRISEYKEVILDLREQLAYYKDKSNRQTQHLHEASKQIMTATETLTKLQYDIEFLKNQYQEVKIREKQWEIQRANMNVVLDLREKSTKETHKEYQITLEENNRLYISLSDQRKVMQEYQREKKNFNTKIISIVSENSYNKRKFEELSRKYEALEEKYNQTKLEKEELDSKYTIQVHHEEGLKKHFEIVETNMAEMHQLNMTQTQELAQLKLFYQSINQILNDKNSATQVLSLEKSNLAEKHQLLSAEYNELVSTLKIAEEKLQQTEEALLKTGAKLTLVRDTFEEKEESYLKVIRTKEEELEVLNRSLEKVLREFKNEKFERNSLNTMYSQTLKIIESKNEEEKSLNVKISLIEGELSKEKNRYLILEQNMIQLISSFGDIQEKLEATLEEQREELYSYQGYRHPMIIEDLEAQVQSLLATKELQSDQIQNLELTLTQERVASKQEFEKSSSGYRWQMNKMKAESERITETLKNEIKYEKEQNAKHRAKLEELETLAETYRKKIYQKSSSEREEVYRFMLEEKRKQIQGILQEMELLQDQLAKTKKQMAEIILSHQSQLLASQESLRIALNQSLRKELKAQLEVMRTEMERNLRMDYLKKEQKMREDRDKLVSNLSLQQFFKMKNLKPEEVLNEIKERLNLSPNKKGNASLKQSRYRQEEMRRRQQLSQLIKNAAQYYEQ